MSNLLRRVNRIKLTKFVDALEMSFPEIDIPDKLPAKVCCLLPDHEDGTPSFWLREERWHCFGCGKGGDIVDFTRFYYDCKFSKAVVHVETALGIGSGKNADIQALLLMARTKKRDTRIKRWAQVVERIQDEYTQIIRPYILCKDSIVREIANSQSNYVYGELDLARSEAPSVTERSLRERSRKLRRWATDWGYGLERFISVATGKDPLDVALQRR